MALKVFKGKSAIGGFPLHQDDEIANGKWSDVDEKFCVCVHHEDDTIAFRLADENGENGCTPETLIEAAYELILERNKKNETMEVNLGLVALSNALHEFRQQAK